MLLVSVSQGVHTDCCRRCQTDPTQCQRKSTWRCTPLSGFVCLTATGKREEYTRVIFTIIVLLGTIEKQFNNSSIVTQKMFYIDVKNIRGGSMWNEISDKWKSVMNLWRINDWINISEILWKQKRNVHFDMTYLRGRGRKQVAETSVEMDSAKKATTKKIWP